MIESAVVDATQEMANRWLTDGRRVVQALLVSVEGSAPLPEGAMLVVDGPELLDRNVARTAAGLLEEGRTALCRFGADGATLGAELRVHVRAYASPPKMVVVGAIDFAAAIAPIAAALGYVVTILDARERFARSGRFTAVAEVRVGWPQDLIPEIELGARDVVLVFTHDSKFDEPALLAALATRAGYIGALGSRQTSADRESRLPVSVRLA